MVRRSAFWASCGGVEYAQEVGGGGAGEWGFFVLCCGGRWGKGETAWQTRGMKGSRVLYQSMDKDTG